MTQEQQVAAVIALILLAWWVRYRRRGPAWAHGTAYWADLYALRRAGLVLPWFWPFRWLVRLILGNHGIIIGRTQNGKKLIKVSKFVHTSVFAPTGAGKSVSYVVPMLLTYKHGSVFTFDPKGELHSFTGRRRERWGNVIRVDPFEQNGPGGACFNPLAHLRADDPQLVDDARALASAIVARPPEGEKDPFWNDSAVTLLTFAIVATILMMAHEERNLNTVREFCTNDDYLKVAIERVKSLGGIPARYANQVQQLTKTEKTWEGVRSSANSHCAVFDSPMVAAMLAKSDFSPEVLCDRGATIYFILPVGYLDSHKGLLRIFTASLMGYVMRHGVKRGSESLWLLDECASLSGLPTLSTALQLGRGRGVRLFMFFQTCEQAAVAFKETPNLVSDNCDTKIYFGTNSFASAQQLSDSLGTWTATVASSDRGRSGSRPFGGSSLNGGDAGSRSWSSSTSLSEISRPLMFPAEIMQMPPEDLICLTKGCPPIYAKRIFWYRDELFVTWRWLFKRLLWWSPIIALVALWAWNNYESWF